eukprot:2434291-Prymnesium_polylepis.1
MLTVAHIQRSRRRCQSPERPMTAPGINIRLRVPLASVDNNVLPQPATTKPHAATNARRPASTAPFEVVCEVDEEASSLLAVAGPV